VPSQDRSCGPRPSGREAQLSPRRPVTVEAQSDGLGVQLTHDRQDHSHPRAWLSGRGLGGRPGNPLRGGGRGRGGGHAAAKEPAGSGPGDLDRLRRGRSVARGLGGGNAREVGIPLFPSRRPPPSSSNPASTRSCDIRFTEGSCCCPWRGRWHSVPGRSSRPARSPSPLFSSHASRSDGSSIATPVTRATGSVCAAASSLTSGEWDGTP
jgi:hypothetical protein